MKTVFEAGFGIEARMVLHLLQGAGIQAQVLGELLQGALGDLPAGGMVRVVVDDSEEAEARALIAEWESSKV